jgi:hypothetical protein
VEAAVSILEYQKSKLEKKDEPSLSSILMGFSNLKAPGILGGGEVGGLKIKARDAVWSKMRRLDAKAGGCTCCGLDP